MSVLKQFKPDLVDLVGDIDNADSTSRWAVGTPDAAIPISDSGARDTKQFLKDVRASGKRNADIHLYDGNHGWTRHEAYMLKNAPAMMEEVTADSIYEFNKAGVEWHRYDDLPFNRFLDMYVHHGNAVSKHSGESVKADIDSWGVSLIRGHSHRLGSYLKSYELTGQELEGYEIGHLMDIKQVTYTNVRNWQQGFIYGYIDQNAYYLTLVQIKNYVCYVDGKRFEA
jgi:hypothetical protein